MIVKGNIDGGYNVEFLPGIYEGYVNGVTPIDCSIGINGIYSYAFAQNDGTYNDTLPDELVKVHGNAFVCDATDGLTVTASTDGNCDVYHYAENPFQFKTVEPALKTVFRYLAVLSPDVRLYPEEIHYAEEIHPQANPNYKVIHHPIHQQPGSNNPDMYEGYTIEEFEGCTTILNVYPVDAQNNFYEGNEQQNFIFMIFILQVDWSLLQDPNSLRIHIETTTVILSMTETSGGTTTTVLAT
ncbi:hypothetical protein BDA99DRAFT_555182 [Phascolomyces articulosus]|uniref:Uncharacterized protein n=1 Tax=Phascolomyces articulosus TaxID=60185 RepID=A0AAD5KQG1_9FUNG|nr:hypothetical protein BDA99DRAFT_555182 [Phascolomyces articulosus]